MAKKATVKLQYGRWIKWITGGLTTAAYCQKMIEKCQRLPMSGLNSKNKDYISAISMANRRERYAR